MACVEFPLGAVPILSVLISVPLLVTVSVNEQVGCNVITHGSVPMSVRQSVSVNKSDVVTYVPELQSWLADVSAQARVWARTARCLATWPPGCALCWPCSTHPPLSASRTAEGQGRLCAGGAPRPPLCGVSAQRSARTAPAQPPSDAATPKRVAMKIERKNASIHTESLKVCNIFSV